jgi:hypothetical protein
MKSTRVFLSIKSVPFRIPAGADPFTYREKRPLRFRASWWTRGTSTELYQSKIVSSEEAARRLAHVWLDRQNKDGERWIDTTRESNQQSTGTTHATILQPGTLRIGDLVRRSDINKRNHYVIVDINGPWIYTRRINGSGGPGIVTFSTHSMLERVS